MSDDMKIPGDKPATPLNLPPADGRYNINAIYDIPVSDIFADAEFNVRGEIAPPHVAELARDIKEHGLLQPITVQIYNKDDHPGCRFRIIAGHRRFLAHQIAGLTHIRSVIKIGISDVDAVAFNLIENVQRQELNKWQEAQAIKRLKMLGLTEQETARKVGKSRGWVQVRYMILRLPIEVQKEIEKGLMTDEQVRTCAGLPEGEMQILYAKEVKDKKLLGKKREPKVVVKTSKDKHPRNVEEIFELQEQLQEAFGHDVKTLICGWCAGYTSNYDLYQAIAAVAKAEGKYFPVPKEFQNPPSKEEAA